LALAPLLISGLLIGFFVIQSCWKIDAGSLHFITLGTLVSSLAIIFVNFSYPAHLQIVFKGSSALVFNFLFLLSFIFLSVKGTSKANFVLSLVTFCSVAFLFGCLESRAWMLASLTLVLMVFVNTLRSKSILRGLSIGITLLIIGSFGFVLGNHTIPQIATEQKVEVSKYAEKITNPLSQLSQFSGSLKHQNVFNLNPSPEISEPCPKIDIELLVGALPKGASDAERFVEPLIGFLIWLSEPSVNSILFGNGLYLSKSGFVDCMSAFHVAANLQVETNIGIFRGNTISTFPFEGGVIGMLLIFTVVMRLIFFERLDLKFFTAIMASSILLTNIVFNGTFILLVSLAISKFLLSRVLHND